MTFKKKLTSIVKDDEPLIRYIFSKEHYSKENKRLKRQAFMPPKDINKLSVFRSKDCPEDTLLKIGQDLEKQRSQTLKAFCSVLTREVRNLELDVVSDTSNNQHEKHANIINFPEAKIRQIANDLANLATENKSLLILESIHIPETSK